MEKNSHDIFFLTIIKLSAHVIACVSEDMWRLVKRNFKENRVVYFNVVVVFIVYRRGLTQQRKSYCLLEWAWA